MWGACGRRWTVDFHKIRSASWRLATDSFSVKTHTQLVVTKTQTSTRAGLSVLQVPLDSDGSDCRTVPDCKPTETTMVGLIRCEPVPSGIDLRTLRINVLPFSPLKMEAQNYFWISVSVCQPNGITSHHIPADGYIQAASSWKSQWFVMWRAWRYTVWTDGSASGT